MKIAYINLQDVNRMESAIQEAVACLENGGAIVYPTDTVYGLGCDAMNSRAVEKIMRLKNRDAGKPLSVIVHDLDAIKKIAFVDNIKEEIVYELLPGPYTLLFPGVKNIPPIVTAGHNSIGVRIPDHPVTRKLSEKFGGPIITTSVNISGENPFNDPFIIAEYFKDLKDRPDLILDCGKISSTGPSVVIDITQKKPQIKRSGMMSVEEIKDLLEKLQKF